MLLLPIGSLREEKIYSMQNCVNREIAVSRVRRTHVWLVVLGAFWRRHSLWLDVGTRGDTFKSLIYSYDIHYILCRETSHPRPRFIPLTQFTGIVIVLYETLQATRLLMCRCVEPWSRSYYNSAFSPVFIHLAPSEFLRQLWPRQLPAHLWSLVLSRACHAFGSR